MFHVEIEPDPETPEVTGFYTWIAVRETDVARAIELARRHPDIAQGISAQVEDTEPLVEDVFAPGETVSRMGGRAFHGPD